jgi:ankyrin repeat protein
LAGHEGAVSLLMQAGCDANAHDMHGNSGSHYAAVLNQPSILSLLLAGGGDVRRLSRTENLACLNIAAGNGHVEVVRLLIQHGADVNEGAGRKGGAALHYSIANQRTEVAELLLEAGADPTAVDDHGYMPLYFAAVTRQLDMIRLLVRKGASLKACAKVPLSPLQLACAEGHLDTVSLLLSLGAPVGENEGIALRLATVNNDLKLAAFLLGMGAAPDMADTHGFCPLHLAASRGHGAMAHLLLSWGANPCTRTGQGLGPWHCAFNADHYPLGRKLWRAARRSNPEPAPYDAKLDPFMPTWQGEKRGAMAWGGGR